MKKRLIAIVASVFAAMLLWSGIHVSSQANGAGNDWERHHVLKAGGSGNDWEQPSLTSSRGNDWE